MKRSTRLLLSISSGVILSLAWLKFPGWILFVALLPLLVLDDFFVREKKQFRSVSFWGHTYLAFFIWNGLTTWWVMHATPFGAILVIFLNSFLMSVTWWLAHSARRVLPANSGYLALIVFWISFEFFHYHWEIEWPWLTLGNGFANNVRMIQWYEYTGTAGGTLWILIINILLFKTLNNIARGKTLKSNVGVPISLALLVFLPSAISWITYSGYTEKYNPRKILIIQPNVDPYNESFDDQSVNQTLDKFVRLVQSNITDSVNFIVGPETVFEEQWNEEQLNLYPRFNTLAGVLDFARGSELVIGASTYRIYHPGEKVPGTARTARDGSKFDRFNSSVFVSSGRDIQVYHKSILVSGVEKMPYRKYLRFLEKFILNLGGTYGSLGVQEEPTNFTASDGSKIAVPICYESAFGGYIAEFVRKGAGLIFIITNDGWWKDTPGYKQHMSFARLRAIETRRSIARSANTGISCFINQRGDILQKLAWWHDATLTGKINANDKLTFYVKYGEYIARISLYISGLLLLYMIALRFRRKQV
jgi:apolipoprotein N-acyltransferase